MEFTGMTVERYGFSDSVVDIVLAGMISFIPGVLILAWHHGAPGKDEWGNIEKVGIPTNITMTLAIVLFVAFNGYQPTQTITQATETQTNTISLEPQVNTDIKRIGIFFFDSNDVSEQDRWLSYGLSYLVWQQLNQDANINASSFYDNVIKNIFWQVQRAGFKDGLNAPQSLTRSIAYDSNMQYFTQASFSVQQDLISVKLNLLDTQTSRIISSIEVEHSDIFELTLTLTDFLKQQAELLPSARQIINEIPIRDFITDSPDALKLYITGLNQALIENDIESAVNHVQQAIELDSDFAIAHKGLADLHIADGKLVDAKEALQRALRFEYKLHARDRFMIRASIYELDQDIEQQKQVYLSWIDLYPNDYVPKNMLAEVLMWKTNEYDKAIELFNQSLSLNPGQPDHYSAIAGLYLRKGDLELAKKYYEKYSTKAPSSYIPLVQIGNIDIRQGELNQARRNFQKAALLRTDMVTPVLSLANLELREGNLTEAERRFREAETISQAPLQQGVIFAHQVDYYYLLGQPQKAFNLLRLYQDISDKSNKFFESAFSSRIAYMYLYVAADQRDLALTELGRLEQELDENMKDLVHLGYLLYYLSINDKQNAEQSFTRVTNIIDKLQMANLRYLVKMAEGDIYMLNNNTEAAITSFEQALSLTKKWGMSGNSALIESVITQSLISAYRQSGNSEKAKELALAELNSWPMHPDINLELAKLYLDSGDEQSAQQHIENVKRIWADAEQGCARCSRVDELI
ncbi:MAG: tetratricopeptide repeat protein, partial [Kangiellaceae bacterium]|jgi:tetratricopeptide (TPR) repeat protein|nr:tetratricopeptide repeat protein [Kangiellaceae bacterium]